MSNLPEKRHPDTAKSIAIVDDAYKEIVDGFETLDELSESSPEVTAIILSQNSNLARIYQEYRSAVAKNDVMMGTVDAGNITIEELRAEVEELRRLRDLRKDQILTPRQMQNHKDKRRGERNSALYNQLTKSVQSSVRR